MAFGRRRAHAWTIAAIFTSALLQPARATAQTFDVTVDQGSTWSHALADSLRLLAIEHGVRVAFQPKTRRELGGPFWADYRRSLTMPDTWEDGDSWLVNYLGHPIHGAAAGRVWIDHDPHGRALTLSLSKAYWASRGRAAAWAAAYSVQFEFGPISEASIGNVGLRAHTRGWVDHVVTPVGAFALVIAEDALDRYLVQFVERHTTNRFFRAAVRLIFTPAWVMANLAEGRAPWHRNARPLR
jgi:hypothetical protein